VQARPAIEAAVAAMRLLDALASLGSLVGRSGFAFPEILPPAARQLELRGLFHPQLSHVVPNDVVLDDAASVMVLTGPNMAGKSTFLRALGVAVLLAHVGAPVPAQYARISRCDRLFGVFGVSDSLLRGESYFLAEVRRIGELASALDAGDVTVSLVDEAFRGTNVSDASDATALLVESLRQCGLSFSVVATHLVEVADRHTGSDGVSCACFDAHHDGSAWRLPFRLRNGVSSQRLGMLLLEREGVAATLRRIQSGTPIA
jgi:DNA mismatch repair ATPase MutS